MKRKFFNSLSGKFFAVLIPVFLTLAGAGFSILSSHDNQGDGEILAARVGNQLARTSVVLGRYDITKNPRLARDLISSLGSDRSILCVEVRKNKDDLIAALPPVIGSKNIANGELLQLPIGQRGGLTLRALFSAAELKAVALDRRNLSLLIVTISFVVSVTVALMCFRWIVGQPLKKLHTAIWRISTTGQRVRVDVNRSDELGQIIRAFNKMIEYDERKEQRIEEANFEISELNRSLEKRVEERTLQLEGELGTAPTFDRKFQFRDLYSRKI